MTSYRCLEIVLQDSFCKVRVYSQRVVKEKACRAWECSAPRDPVPHHAKRKTLRSGAVLENDPLFLQQRPPPGGYLLQAWKRAVLLWMISLETGDSV